MSVALLFGAVGILSSKHILFASLRPKTNPSMAVSVLSFPVSMWTRGVKQFVWSRQYTIIKRKQIFENCGNLHPRPVGFGVLLLFYK